MLTGNRTAITRHWHICSSSTVLAILSLGLLKERELCLGCATQATNALHQLLIAPN